MVGMAEIDTLDVGMGDKMVALVCWNLNVFSMPLWWKIIYIF